MPAEFYASHLSDLDPVTLYKILRLRTDVFVVEQACAYPELDGRDLERDSLMVWAADADRVTGTLRILRDTAGNEAHAAAFRIGRVTAHPEFRGTSLARQLFTYAIAVCTEMNDELPIVLDAQEPLAGWYAEFGFARTGAPFLDDGISHVPMRRESHKLQSRLSDLNR